MAPRVEDGRQDGTISAPVRPTLDVRTGFDDDPRRTLVPGDSAYRLALAAWRHQDAWPLDMWRDLWTALLPMWPRRDGPPGAPMEQLARVAGKMHASGASFKQIEEAIPGYAPDSLRRRGLRAGAREFIAGAGVHRVGTGPNEPEAVRFVLRLEREDGTSQDLPVERVLPRVYSLEMGDAPPPLGGWLALEISRMAAEAHPRNPLSRDSLDTIRATLAG